MVIGPEHAALLVDASSLVVGTVAPDGEPRAARGWGAMVTPGDSEFRLVLDADDEDLIANLRSTGAIAVTGASVYTFRSLQVKGRVVRIETPTALDLAMSERSCEMFFGAVEETDGTSRETLRRLLPANYVVCVVEAEEFFDQTPGPGAGAGLPEAAA